MSQAQKTDTEKTKPLVWIIIVNWNGKGDTLACLESLREVPYQPRRILVIDNASTDGSIAAIEAGYPEVEVLRNRRNEGFARANNQGIKLALAAGSEFVLLLNNDTEVEPNFLDHLVLAALFHKNAGMVAPKIYYHDRPQVIWFAGGRINFWTGHTYHLRLREFDLPSFEMPKPVDYLSGCALLVKKECIEKIGLLDESYHIYAEDVDWSMRARQAGFICLFQPEAKVWHKISASSGTAFKAYHKVRGNFQFYKKYARWYHWLTIPFGVAFGLIREIVRQILFQPIQALRLTNAMARGFRDILLQRPPQKKNKIQPESSL